ncbi:choice-of-anchor D domain-containing protein [Planctomycetales bacterium ZRK34]|nr:choice-of-anchor D domain-containing protein [Planctomycetales bacterium ZRK34]
MINLIKLCKLVFDRSGMMCAAVLPLYVFAVLCSPASAVDTTWTFDGDGDWTEAANWDNGQPINNTFDVFIDDGDTAVTVFLSVNPTINDITIGADDELSFSNGADLFVQGDVFNDGLISLNSTGSFTDLSVNGDGSLTLNGSGTVMMIGNANNRITGTGTLINTATHTIAGTGQIGTNGLAINNAGLIDANINGAALFIDSVSSGSTNTGTMRASNGGLLQLTGAFTGAYDNTSGVLEAVGADSQVQLLNNASVAGGTLQTSGGGVIQTNALQTSFLSDVTNTGDYIIRNGGDGHILGTITNSGTITVEADTGEAELLINGDVTLTGGGTVQLTQLGAGGASLNDGGGAGQNRLTNVNNTIQGAGQIGQNNMSFTNGVAGLVDANVTGQTILMDPGASPNDAMTSFINNGTFRASNGGILTLSGVFSGAFDNSNGVIEAIGAGSQVQLTSNASVVGGTFETTGGGFIQTNSSQSTFLTDVALIGDYIIRDNADAGIFGTSFHNQGTITIEADGNETELEIGSDLMLTGGGVVQLVRLDGGQAVINDDGGDQNRLTNVNNIIQGAGLIGQNTMAFTNQADGLVDANVTGDAIVLDPGSTPLDGGTSFINMGTYRASNGGVLALTGVFGGDFDNNGGVIEAVGADSQIQFLNNASVIGGTLQTSDGGFIQTNASQTSFLADLTIAGDYFIRNNADANIGGAISNTGTITIDPDGNETELVINGDVTLTGGGVVKLTAPTSGYSSVNDGGGDQNRLTNVDNTFEGTGLIGQNNMAFTNQAGGLVNANITGQTLTLDPCASPIDGESSFINRGTYRASNGGILALTGSLGGDFDNTDGVIEAVGVDSRVELLGNVSVAGGALQAFGSSFIQTNASQTTFLTDMILAGDYFIRNNADANIAGAINNTGTITIDPDGNETELVINGDVTLTGGGTVKLTAPAGGYSSVNDGGGDQNRLTNVNNTFEGTGLIGQNNMAFTNQAGGLVNANITGQTLTLDPALSPVDGETSFINLGTYRASNGGILVMTGSLGGDFDNAGGVIEAVGIDSRVELTGSVSIAGGTLQTSGGGIFQTNAGQTTFLADLTIAGDYFVRNNADAYIDGAINNTGTITVDPDGNFTELRINGDVTLNGGGTIRLTMPGGGSAALNDGGGSQNRLTNADNTIEGVGLIGSNTMALTNEAEGLIDANVNGGSITIDPGATPLDGLTSFINSGKVRASNGGTLTLTGSLNGGFMNTTFGTFEALDGSLFQMIGGASLSNISGGVLDGGNYRIIDEGGGAAMSLLGTPINTIAAQTTVELSGAGSTLTFNGTAIESTLHTNSGNLMILGGRDYAAAPATFTNTLSGVVSLGGGTFSVPNIATQGDFSNAGQITGFGMVVQRPTNTGTISAVGGTLAFGNGIQGGSGEVIAFDGATVDLSAGSMDSSADHLTLLGDSGSGGGMLNLGANDFHVMVDYSNGNFGVGNSFNHRVNVSGTGLILADNPFTISLGGDFAGGVIDFGELHAGDTITKNLVINHDGKPGESPDVRVAIQTSVNGGNITDGQLSGAGVTASNLGPIAAGGNSGPLGITITAANGGALTGQTIHVEDNFDNVDSVNTEITGAVYRFANPTDHTPEPVNFGNVRLGSVVNQNLSLTNDVIDDGFSENLNAAIASDGTPVSAAGSFSGLAPGMTDNASLSVGVDTSTAGAKVGSATISLQSDGTGINSLGITDLSSQTVNVSASVYRPAEADLAPVTVNLGIIHVGDGGGMISQSLTSTNIAANDGFSEHLDGSFVIATGAGVSGSGNFTNLATDSSSDALSIAVDTSAARAVTGSATYNFQSNGSNFGLGPNIDLGNQSVNIAAQVNNYADPILNAFAGVGSLTMNSATEYTLDLGAINTGEGDVAAMFDVFNNAPIANSDTLSGMWDLNGGSSAFGFTGFDPFTDIAGQSGTGPFAVILIDDVAGVYSHSIYLNPSSDNADSNTALNPIELIITGVVATPELTASPDPVDFGAVLVGMSATQSVTVGNTGDDRSTLSGSFGSAASPFSPDSDQPYGPLDDGESVMRDYSFAPTVRGDVSDDLTITSNAGNQTIGFTGQGVAPVADAADGDAGFVRIGDMGTLSATITNIGDGNLSGLGDVSNLKGSLGGAAGAFAGTGGLFNLMDGASMQFDYTFAPNARGTDSQTVSLNLDNGNPDGSNTAITADVTLVGEGVGPEYDSVVAPGQTMDFGAVLPGGMSFRDLTIMNVTLDLPTELALTGLSILDVLITGDDAADFIVVDFTSTAIAKGDDLTLTLKFTGEGADGLRTAMLTIFTDQGAPFGGDGLDFSYDLVGLVDSTIPEPTAWVTTGLVMLAGLTRRRRR